VWSRPQQEPFGVSPPDENPSGLGVFPFPLRESNYYEDKETGTFYAMLRDGYDPAKGRFDQFDPIGLAGGSMSPYTYVSNNPLRFTDPLGLATYMCTRRLNNVPFRAGPLYHQFICVGNAQGGFTCGGLGPSTSSIFNTPGIIESDTMKPQSCQLVQDDNDCVEQCIKDTFGKPPPNYSVDLSRGENCQTYADAAVFDCVARCKTRKK
jgi:RHS repeat-associated protein